MKTYVWSLATRVFHWLLAIFILLAFILSDSERLLDYHAAVGYGIGVLIVFRIIWGFIGPKYSTFNSWPLSIKEAVEFSKNILSPKKEYIGHNPAASFVMLGIIIVTFLVTISGILAYGIQEGRGVLAFLNETFFKEMELFEELHEALANLLIMLIVIHLIGVFVDRVLHPKSKTLQSIFNGYKEIEGKDVKLNIFQKIFAFVMITLSIAVVIYALSSNSILTKSRYTKVDYEAKNELFVSECASCHTLYPPFLLPKASWQKLMRADSLKNHFGDDASLDEEDRVEILNFLVKNSAQNSTKESAFYINKSLKNDKNITIAITKTPYWIKKHKNIDKDIFKSKEVKSKANCKACHSDIENGLIEDKNIKKL